jgi:hypothetical protein
VGSRGRRALPAGAGPGAGGLGNLAAVARCCGRTGAEGLRVPISRPNVPKLKAMLGLR